MVSFFNNTIWFNFLRIALSILYTILNIFSIGDSNLFEFKKRKNMES